MTESDALEELLRLRREIDAALGAGIQPDSSELVGLSARHDDLMALVGDQTIVPVGWEDDWSPKPRGRPPEGAATR